MNTAGVGSWFSLRGSSIVARDERKKEKKHTHTHTHTVSLGVENEERERLGVIKGHQLVSENRFVDGSVNGEGRFLVPSINKGEVRLVPIPAALALVSSASRGMLHHRKGVARSHCHNHKGFTIRSGFRVLARVVQLGGEVDPGTVKPVIGGTRLPKSILTDLPHTIIAGPLQHRNNLRFPVMFPGTLLGVLGVPLEVRLPLLCLRLLLPVRALELVCSLLVLSVERVAVILEVGEEPLVGDSVNFGGHLWVKSKLAHNLGELVEEGLVVSLGPILDEEGVIAATTKTFPSRGVDSPLPPLGGDSRHPQLRPFRKVGDVFQVNMLPEVGIKVGDGNFRGNLELGTQCRGKFIDGGDWETAPYWGSVELC